MWDGWWMCVLPTAGIHVRDCVVAALAQGLEDLEAELKSISVEVSQLELHFCNSSNIFLQTARQFWLLLPRALSLSCNKTLRGFFCSMCLLPEGN